MASHIYKKQYTSPTEFNVIQVRADGNRTVSKDKPDYLLFLQEGNTPEVIPYVAPVEPTLEELKVSKISMLKDIGRNVIENKCPPFKQRNVGMGRYSAEKSQEIISYIDAKNSEIDAIEAAIIAATSKEEVELININIAE